MVLMTQFTFPSEEQILEMVRANATPPNLNAAMETLQAQAANARESITSIASQASASFTSTVTSQITTARSHIDSLLENIQVPARNLQTDIRSALTTLQLNPDRFLDEIETIRTNFPSADIDSILDSISNGTLNVAVDVPNIDVLADGVEQLRAIPSLIAQEVAETIPDLPELPEIQIPEFPKLEALDVNKLIVNSNNVVQFSNTFVELGHRLASLRSRLDI